MYITVSESSLGVREALLRFTHVLALYSHATQSSPSSVAFSEVCTVAVVVFNVTKSPVLIFLNIFFTKVGFKDCLFSIALKTDFLSLFSVH